MLPHQLISRAMLRAKGRHVPEFFGLAEADFRELTILAHHCEKELGLKTVSLSPLGPDSSSGVRLELSGGKRGRSYSVRVSPLGGVSLSTGPFGGQSRQVFRNKF